MRTLPRALAALLSLVLAATLAVVVSGAPADARPARPEVAQRAVVFTLTNVNTTSVLCSADNRTHRVRARLVGPRKVVLGQARSGRINVLVHDAGTGAWFWNLRGNPAYDYATQLARKGETSLVLDRLGYDASPLADGTATCLGAQAHLLHQVVQHLYSGIYHYVAKPSKTPPHAAHVVVQGHGTGAAIAQLEAATYDDTDGLVLMGWSPAPGSQAALSETARQLRVCNDSDYAAYGADAAAFRKLLFVTAPAAVQRAAAQRRNPTPCGDVTSLGSALLTTSLDASKVEVPVLVMAGAEDARLRSGSTVDYANSSGVTRRTVAGAGSALPLERSAAKTRASVLAWLHRL